MATKATQDDVAPRRTCGTMQVHERLLRTLPQYVDARMVSETNAIGYGLRASSIERSGVTVIPTVVHVVSKTAQQDISDAQIQSQIEVLNLDFRKLNPDVASVPAPFQPLAADARVEFVLATTDPNGAATNGITRRTTTVTSFADDDSVKAASTGGADAWPADKYLNVWVCQLGGGLLGYAQFPGGPLATDGVVILHSAFGNSGTAAAPFGLGRSATHEIGHWLNLRHIWGDDGTGCNGSDLVNDTPNQAGPNFGSPTFASITCTNGPNGDLFVNYMDYVDDVAMFMFTNDQVTRMQACLDGDRPAVGYPKPGKLKFIDDPLTFKFNDDHQTLKVIDDPITLKFSDDPQTLKFSDDPQTLKFIDDPVTLKFSDDPQTLKFIDDPVTLKFSDDPQTLKFIDDPNTFKFIDDPNTLKFSDDPQTLKFNDDPQTIKFLDDGPNTSPSIDPIKTPDLDKPPFADSGKPPALDGPGGPGDPGGPVMRGGAGGASPFILSTGHHSMAWTRSFPGAAQAARSSYEELLHGYEQRLAEYAQAAQAGQLRPEDIAQADRLFEEYQAIANEYRQFSG